MAQEFKKIRARSLSEAYRLMRDQFGLDALVMSTETVNEGGIFGFFGKEMVEVTVAVQTPDLVPSGRSLSAVERKYTATGGAPRNPQEAARLKHYEALVRAAQERMQGGGESVSPMPESIAAVEQPKPAHVPQQAARAETPVPAPRRTPAAASSEATFPAATFPAATSPESTPVRMEQAFTQSNVAHEPKPVLPFPKPQEPGPNVESLRRELAEMRDMLQVMYSENPSAGLPTEFAHHYRHLVNLGVSRRVAAQLVAAVLRNADLDALRTGRLFEERLKLEIRRRVRVTGGIATEAGTCRVVALCGPTGVGKTTTLAKLAARFAVRERARVAAITADTYRIAAPEQLRVYANIVGVPLTVVNDPQEMRRALDQYRQYDLVFIDTAGSSQFNLDQINELKGVLEAARPCETLLALAANTQIADLRNVVSNFKCLNPTSVIFTKVDETRQYGSLLTVLVEAGLPLSYLSTGQNVPDDIRVAASATVANLIMEGRDYRG